MHPTPATLRRRHPAREAALTLGAVAGVLCLLLAALAFGLGIKPLVFRSGSMGPEIRTGALGLARTVPAAELRVGDVVSVITASGSRVTHRITAIDPDPVRRPGAEVVTLTLRGDANPVPDAEAYVAGPTDRLFWHADRLGYAVTWLSGPYAAFGAGLLVGGLLVHAFSTRRPGPRRQARPQPDRSTSAARTGPPVVTGAAVLLVGAALVTARLGPVDTQASFNDAASATSGALTGYAVPAPVLSCSTATGTSVTVRWTAVPGATGYTVTRVSGGVTTTTPVPATSLTASRNIAVLETGTFQVQATVAYGSTTWTSARSNTASYSILLVVISTCSV